MVAQHRGRRQRCRRLGNRQKAADSAIRIRLAKLAASEVELLRARVVMCATALARRMRVAAPRYQVQTCAQQGYGREDREQGWGGGLPKEGHFGRYSREEL